MMTGLIQKDIVFHRENLVNCSEVIGIRKDKTMAKQQINRFSKSHMLVKLNAVKPTSHDQSGRIKSAFVPGSAAKTYEVIVRREGRNFVEVECLLQTGGGPQECKGGWQTVCYHALAVLLTSARDRGFEAAICKSEHTARLRKNLNGRVYTVKSKFAPDNPLWFVVDGNGDKEVEEKVEIEPKPKKTEAEMLKELGYD